MVTWTSDLVALSVGFFIGVIIGGFAFLIIETRDGGNWCKGF